LDLLAKINLRTSPPPVVMVTGQGDQVNAVAALKAGAADYLVKQTDYLNRLPVVITNVIAQSRLVHEQAALRTVEARYQSLVEQTPAVVFLSAADEAETPIYISPMIEKLTGYNQEEWLKSPSFWKQVIYPQDAQRIQKAFDESHNNSAPFIEEYRVTRRDGRLIWLKESTHLILDQNWSPLYWQGILLDITKEKELLAAQEESDQRFRRVFHSSPIATCVVTLQEGKFIDANKAFLNLVGKELDELIGHTSIEMGYWENLPGRDRKTFIEELRKTGTLHDIEVQYVSVPDGPRETLAYYEIIELSSTPCVLAMFYDVTEQKKSQRALQGERDFALQVLNAMGQGLTVTSEQAEFEYVNPAYANMMGYSQQDLIGKSPVNVTSPSLQQAHEYERTRRQNSETSTYETRLVHKNGHEVPVIITGVPRIQHGKVTGTIAVITDLTAVKRAEESLAQQVKELTILQSVAQAEVELAASEDDVIEKITGILGQIYPEVCGVLLLDETGKSLTPHLSYRGADVSNWMEGYPITDGVTGRAALTGKPIVLGDVRQDPSYIEIASGIRSELCVPIRVSDRIIGVLNVESKRANAFDDGDERFLVTIAGGLGSALERARLFQAEQKRIRELEIINHLSASLRSAQSLDDMLPVFLNESLGLVDAAHISIWLYDPSINFLIQRTSKGSTLEIKTKSINLTEGFIGQAFAGGKTVITNNLATDPKLFYGINESEGSTFGSAAIPIQSTAGPVGVLLLIYGAKRQPTTSEFNLLTILSGITGNAIHRAELFEQGQEQIRRLTALRDIDSAIASSTDLRVTLNILAEHALKHLKVDAVDILLYRHELQSLTPISGAGFKTMSPSRPIARIGEGLAGQIAMKGRPEHIVDLKNSPEAKNDSLLAREGFVTYIGVPLIVKGQIKGVFEFYHRTPLSPSAEWMQFLHTLAGQAAIAIDNSQLFNNLQKSNQELTQAYDTTLEGWARALELRDRETEGHARRVTDLTLQLASVMGIKDDDLVNIYRGVLLHDIGKMGVPDNILKKTGPLTETEWEDMRRHPQYAYDLLSPINYLRPALDIPYCHHEHWDGSGYPRGLQGEQIPLSARIFSVVDIWDALLSDRPYRKAWDKSKVIEYIQGCSGKILDPDVVKIFLNMIRREA